MFKLMKNKSFRNLILFDFLYQLSFILILAPFGKELFSIIYRFTKSGFFSIENAKTFMTSPFKILTISIIGIIFACIRLFEISGFVFTTNQIRLGNEVSVLEIFNNSYKLIKPKITKLQNILILPFVIIGIPLSSFSHKKLELPGFIMDHLFSTLHGVLMAFAYMAIFFILSMKFIFLFQIFLLENKSFFESIVTSIKRIKNNFFKSLKVILIIFIKNSIIEVVKLAILIVIIYFFYNQTESKTLSNISIIIYLCIATLIKIFTNIISNYIYFSSISKFYFEFSKNENIQNKIHSSNKIRLKLALTLIFLILASTISKYRNSVEEIKFFHNLQNLKPKIIAHRGSTKNSAENTMESINEAIELKAEYSEIDVMLTKDNVVVLSHDDNLSRLTGEDVNISELTFEELKTKKIIYEDDKKFNFVDLKTVLENSKNKIKLNIELKPVKHNERKLAEEVEKLVSDRTHDIVISSLSTKALKEMKEINPKISTGLILALVYGNFDNVTFADFFCIEEKFATVENIRKIQKKGKLVYVWTLNKTESIQSLCKKGINGIITDEVQISKETIQNIDFNFNELILTRILNVIK